MTTSRSLSRSERDRLCDTALAAGPDAPTLCGEWTVKDLIAHLVVRDGDPLGAPGIAIKPLAGLTDKAMERREKESLGALVGRVRHPPIWSPYRVPLIDRAANTLEFYVHHEDIRRGSPGWEPRDLTPAEQTEIWKSIGLAGRMLARPAGVPVAIRWEGTDREHVLRRGEDPVTVIGLPGELTLFLFGRDQTAGLAYDGSPDAVSALREAKLGM